MTDDGPGPIDHDATTRGTPPEPGGMGTTPPAPPIPERIGHYKIIRVLGEGGMGTVYEAQQESPRRTVALKVIRAGVASASLLRRFEHEAQILGRLDHPGIATIFEAGTFDSGAGPQPFFAMEMVQGQTLTDYAIDKKLGTRERLELLARIAEAVQHAHQKGVIHRDLKPGNILVTDEGQVKVLDFGVARATDSDIQTTTMRTDIGQLVGTIPYMSPEQAAGDPDELDTRSDVYALGVVAYELLSGRLPYDIAKKMIHEAVRVIREDEPTPLSSINRVFRGDIEIIISKAMQKDKDRRYQSASDFASDIHRYLNDEPIVARAPSTWYQLRKFSKRNKALVGGVVAVLIVSVAGAAVSISFALGEAEQKRLAVDNAQDAREAQTLAEQREQEAERQTTIASAARDAERTAKEDTQVALTLAQQREREAVTARAEETKRAEELELVAEYQASQLSDIDVELMGTRLREDLLAEARLDMERRGLSGEEITAAIGQLEDSLGGTNLTNVALDVLERNILDRALEAVDEQFADQPLVRARLLQTLADTLYDLGLLDRATAPQTEAMEVRRRMLGDEHTDTLGSISNMGALLYSRGKLSEAEPYFGEVLEGHRRVLGDEHPSTLNSINNMGSLLLSQGKLTEAEPYFREALEVSRRVLGDDHPATLTSINNLGALLKSQGKLTEAEPYFREALEVSRRVLGNEHPDTLISINNMGEVLRSQGKLTEAEPYFRVALESSRRVLGDEHPDTLNSIGNMGSLLQSQGKLDEAEPYYREALEGRRRMLGDEHPDTLGSINNMGLLLQSQGRLTEAEAYYREALEVSRRMLGDEHPSTLISINSMGYLLVAQGKLSEAEPYYREALEVSRRVLGNEHPDTLNWINNMGSFLKSQGKLTEAEPYFREAMEGFRRVLGDEHPSTLKSINNMGVLLKSQGKLAEAEPYFREAMEGFRRVLGDEHPSMLVSINNMGGLLRDLERLEEAEALFAEAVELGRKSLLEGHWHMGGILGGYGQTLLLMQRFEDAEEALTEAHGILETALGTDHKHTIGVINSLADLYDAWHESEPGKGYDAKAAEWRAKLPPDEDDPPEQDSDAGGG